MQQTVYVVEDEALATALTQRGMPSVLRSDPQYRTAPKLAAAAMEAAARGIQVVVILRETKYLPWFFAARKLCHQVALLSPFDAGLRAARLKAYRLQSGELAKFFLGWFFQPGDPGVKALPKETSDPKVPVPSKPKTYKSFKQLLLDLPKDLLPTTRSSALISFPDRDSKASGLRQRFSTLRIPEYELKVLWNQNHPRWRPPHVTEAFAPMLGLVMDFLAGIGECPDLSRYERHAQFAEERAEEIAKEGCVGEEWDPDSIFEMDEELHEIDSAY